MNIKIERLNHVFVKEISEILATEIKDDDIHFVTITGCDISSDLSYCKVYYTVLDEERHKKLLSELVLLFAENLVAVLIFDIHQNYHFISMNPLKMVKKLRELLIKFTKKNNECDICN